MAKSDATHCDCDPLVDIFHYAGIVLERLKTHLKVRLFDASVKAMAIPEASQVTQVLVKIMCDLVVAFALATKLVEVGQLGSKSFLVSKSLSNVAVRELCKETTGDERRRQDPSQVRSAHSRARSEDGQACS
jgi:hypothetical protein